MSLYYVILFRLEIHSATPQDQFLTSAEQNFLPNCSHNSAHANVFSFWHTTKWGPVKVMKFYYTVLLHDNLPKVSFYVLHCDLSVWYKTTETTNMYDLISRTITYGGTSPKQWANGVIMNKFRQKWMCNSVNCKYGVFCHLFIIGDGILGLKWELGPLSIAYIMRDCPISDLYVYFNGRII